MKLIYVILKCVSKTTHYFLTDHRKQETSKNLV